jgi:NAD(P)-dependent dehydrogenase (short-subunit alcohol dehydrogenase family)
VPPGVKGVRDRSAGSQATAAVAAFLQFEWASAEVRMKTREQPRPPFPRQHQEKPGREADLRPRPRFEAPDYRPAGKLQDQVALLTGGDSGIGRAVALMFAREGARVAISHLPEEIEDAETTRDAIERAGVEPLLIPADLSEAAECRRIVDEVIRHFGELHILVNNAAYQQHRDAIDDISTEQLEHTFRTNVFSMFHVTRAALAHLPRGGAIVNTGSITGLEGSGGLLDYSATKGAIHAFTKALAQNLQPRGIRVNCVAPGPVWTPLNPSDKPADEVAEFGSGVPMGRPAQPEEIAPAFVFFASNADSSYITGEVLTLLGGETAAG